MINYVNKTSTSCVYDALEQAGILSPKRYMNGCNLGETLRILAEHNWKIFRKGDVAPIHRATGGIFVIRYTRQGNLHAEYHISPNGIHDYNSSELVAIAIK